jgi:hypothetical protein
MAERLTDPEAKQQMLDVRPTMKSWLSAPRHGAQECHGLDQGVEPQAMSGSVVGPRAVSTTGWRLTINNGPQVIRRCSGNPRGVAGQWGSVLILSGS